MSSLSTETWRAVVGWEGIYEVSDHGRVKRVAGGRGCRGLGRILADRPTRKGYLIVRLGGREHTVHSLVMVAFVGPRPPGHECNHANGNKADNGLANLAWTTPSENMRHAFATGLNVALRGEANGRAKLTASQVAEIVRLEGSGTQRSIAARFGISKSRVGQIHAEARAPR